MPLDMEAIIAKAVAKFKPKAVKAVKRREQTVRRERKSRSELIRQNREKRDEETRTVRRRRSGAKAEMLVQECAPILIQHLDVERCIECASPLSRLDDGSYPEKCQVIITDDDGADIGPCGYSTKMSLNRIARGLDGVRIEIRCSKGDHGAFAVIIHAAGEKKPRAYPPASIRQMADKQGWANERLIKQLVTDDRSKDINGTLLGFNCSSTTEMLEEIIRLRSRVNHLEDELQDATAPARHCESCKTKLDDGEQDTCTVCKLRVEE